MARAVTISLQKGGVGKTTIAINLAERLAARGNEVLLVDLDQQGNATEGVGLEGFYKADTHLGHVLTEDDGPDPADVVQQVHNFDVIPAHEDFDDLEDKVRNSTFGMLWLRRKVVEPLLGEEYDYIVVDAPPNLGPLSDAAMIATGNVIVPLLMSEPSVSGFERMVDQQIKPIQNEVELEILAIVPNSLSGNNEEKRIISDLEDSPFSKQLPQFAQSTHFEQSDSPGPGIRDRIAFSRAWREGVPLAEYDPESDMLPRLDELAAIVERGEVASESEEAQREEVRLDG